MALKFITSAESAKQGIKILCYSPAGIGKTVLCSTAPNPFILSAERGLLSIRGHNIPGAQIESLADLEEAYEWVKDQEFETICLDSISELAEVILTHEKDKSKDVRKAYGATSDAILAIFRKFRDLEGKHVYFTAKEAATIMNQGQDSEWTKFGPMLPGNKLQENVPHLFDLVFRLELLPDGKGGEYRAIRTAPTSTIQAKDRSGNLETHEEPHLEKLFNKIKGEK